LRRAKRAIGCKAFIVVPTARGALRGLAASFVTPSSAQRA